MMLWYKISAVFICVALFQIFVPNWFQIVLSADTLSFGFLQHETSSHKENETREKVLFFGDLMLARDVERHMNEEGPDYPFLGFAIASNSFAVANLETAVPEVHKATPNNTFRFSTPVRFLPYIRSHGFTHLSLANNHSFDFGLAGYNNTVSRLWEAELVPFGHPTVLDTTSITYVETTERKIAVIAAHTLYGNPSDEVIADVVSSAVANSDVQILYIHWGEEYALTQNRVQRDLAEKFVSAGVDIVIGHHPHVVQGIEKIDNALVFYSLGNYIFDQYFSPDVLKGLVLELNDTDNPEFVLIPVSTAETHTQPTPMTAENRQNFLADLATRSSPELTDQILDGRISLAHLLATSE